MWVVTSEVNEYNQEGAYFMAAYITKPTFQQLRKLLTPAVSDATVGKLTRGGGREGAEYEWWNLHEVAEGETIYRRQYERG